MWSNVSSTDLTPDQLEDRRTERARQLAKLKLAAKVERALADKKAAAKEKKAERALEEKKAEAERVLAEKKAEAERALEE